MDGTILSQGRFVVGATVIPQIIAIPSGADWVKVYNYTQYGTDGGASANGVEFYWQRGMAANTGIVKYKINTVAGEVLQGDTLTTGGFTLYDPSGQTAGSQSLLGPSVAATGISNATRPVVLATTVDVAVGTVVRVSLQTGDTALAANVCTLDCVVGAVTPGVSLTLLAASNAFANAPGITTGTCHYRIVRADSLFYPRNRTITNITRAANANVSTSVGHGLTVGQEVRFNIPAISGMVQLNPSSNNLVAASVVSVVDLYNFTINVDTTAYTAFTFPTLAQMPGSFPEVTPVGEDTATSLLSAVAQTPLDWNGNPVYNANSGILADSTVNTGFLGMVLGTGGAGNAAGAVVISGPAGTAAADVMYWTCGKSSFGGL